MRACHYAEVQRVVDQKRGALGRFPGVVFAGVAGVKGESSNREILYIDRDCPTAAK